MGTFICMYMTHLPLTFPDHYNYHYYYGQLINKFINNQESD